MEEFKKNDSSKLRYDLVPPEALRELAKVLTYGANKYGADNWRLCDDSSRYLAAAYRHIEAYRMGEMCDPESGLHHLSHALTNLAFMVVLRTPCWGDTDGCKRLVP